jgi:hypothetical protein
MLFSPPNELGKQLLYKQFSYSVATHGLLFIIFFGAELWIGMRPQVVTLRKPGRVMIPSSSRSRTQPGGTVQEQPASPPHKVDEVSPQLSQPVVEKKEETVPYEQIVSEPKKTSKKIPSLSQVKKEKKERKVPMVSKKEAKVVEKKDAAPITQKKTAVEKKEPAKQGAPYKKPEDAKNSRQNDIPQQVAAPADQTHISTTNDQGSLIQGDGQEVHVADVALFEDSVQKEFGRHFTIPEGFEEYDPFTITFDIQDGKVVNISPHTQGALVVYTAVKDALLKSTMPIRSKKRVVWVIT